MLDREFFENLNPRTEFIQSPPRNRMLNDGWEVQIDKNVNGEISRFCLVFGVDKFDAMANANAIMEKLEL